MEEKTKKTKKSKKSFYILVGILTVTSIVFRLLVFNHFEQYSLLFIGLPALITILVIKFYKTPKSGFGIIAKTITIFLLLAGILLGEGIICIIMAAPLFYGIGALIYYIQNELSRRSQDKMFTIVIIPVLIICAGNITTNEEHQISNVTVTQVIDPGLNLNELNTTPLFLNNLPMFLKMGFPKPVSIEGTGLDEGDYREIKFESSTKGIGTLHLKITKHTKDLIVFEKVSDDSHIDHWLSWNKIEISMTKNLEGANVLTWSTDFRCNLQPSWYFEPIERFAIYTSTNHLINSYFLEVKD